MEFVFRPPDGAPGSWHNPGSFFWGVPYIFGPGHMPSEKIKLDAVDFQIGD